MRARPPGAELRSRLSTSNEYADRASRQPYRHGRCLRDLDVSRSRHGRRGRVTEWPAMREACGVFGVYASNLEVAPLVFDGLFSLQHRGQESAGMAVSDGETITVMKDMGLVTSVFNARSLASLQGFLGLGHVRYSTMGKSDWRNAPPAYRAFG